MVVPSRKSATACNYKSIVVCVVVGAERCCCVYIVAGYQPLCSAQIVVHALHYGHDVQFVRCKMKVCCSDYNANY